MNLNNVYFDTLCDEGISGRAFFPNGYGLNIIKLNNNLYNIYFLIKVGDIWISRIDSNTEYISNNQFTINSIDESQVNYYIQSLESITL